MKNLLRDMPLFVEVAKYKSFTLAADALDMPVSTLSRRISAMEKALAVPLFLRNSRNVELTDSGKIFYERCDYIVSDAADACEAIVQNMNKPSGRVRFSIPGDVYMSFFSEALTSFAKIWPDIHLDICFNDRWVDLLTEPYDLDLRVGDLPDSNLKARRIGSGRPFIYASSELMANYSLPLKPGDLSNIPCIGHIRGRESWELTKNGETVTVPLKLVHTFNSISATLDFVLAGLGMACLPKQLAEPHVRAGRLIGLLKDWELPQINAYLVMASHQIPRRVRMLIDHLVNYFGTLDSKLRSR